jgi:Arc/MetJ family transcription regulator
MGAHMKTTIELSDNLLQEAKEAASRQGTTLRAVVEAALRGYLEAQASQPRPAFRLRRHTVGGKGLRPELAEAGWQQILDRSYEGRGG